MNYFHRLILTIIFMFCFSSILYSDIINVPDLHYPTIQSGIDSALQGDTVLVAKSTYYENINFNGKNIVLCSPYMFSEDTTDIDSTIIDGGHNDCVVVFENGEDSTTVLCGFTITNGYASSNINRGGGITCLHNSSPILSNLIITENEVSGSAKINGGGGILCRENSSPILENLKILNNTVSFCDGGAIRCGDSARVVIKNSMIQQNNASYGTIAAFDSWIDLDNVTIVNNNTLITGGGIHLERSNAVIKNSQITKNHVRVSGGGIYSFESFLIVENVLIGYNSATDDNDQGGGGGLFIIQDSQCFVINSNIIFNMSLNGGGGISTAGSHVDLKKVTMGKNQSSGFYGGGIYAWGSDTYIDIEDVKINKNMARRGGGGIYCGINGAGKIRLANVTVSYNRVEYEEGGGIYCESASNIYFSVDSPSRIYLNKAHTYGADMALWFQGNVEAVLDTFTVSEPSEYHLYPRNNFKLTILHPLFKSIDSDLYVSPTGSDSNLGISPHEPLRSLNAALAFASTDSSHQRYIYMAEGTYSPALTDEDLPLYVRSNITILGSNADNTIIDGDDKSQIISIQKAENICLKNITVQNGYDSGVSGGILASTSGNIIFEDLIIRNNRGGYRGGALAISGGLKRDYLIKNILIYANSMFYDEKGGIAGAGLLLSNVNAKLINITIADNKVENSQDVPGGILIENKSNVSLVNSIVYNNSNHAISCQQSFSGSPTLIVTNSNVEGGETGINKDSLTVIHWLEENIDENPLFVGGEPFDYHLIPSSPCIDAGTAFLEFEGDTIVNLLPEEYDGLAPDMGAFGINPVSKVKKEYHVANQFILSQNYPNPFNTSTIITYQIVKPEKVNLSIYNINGQVVEILENRKKSANIYHLIWDASRFASGIYLLKLSTGDYTSVRKMLLVK